jgi:hypothetical protein
MHPLLSQSLELSSNLAGGFIFNALLYFSRRMNNWLVVWTIFYDFPYIGNVIIPTDEL